jgi:hypothetical protein
MAMKFLGSLPAEKGVAAVRTAGSAGEALLDSII